MPDLLDRLKTALAVEVSLGAEGVDEVTFTPVVLGGSVWRPLLLLVTVNGNITLNQLP